MWNRSIVNLIAAGVLCLGLSSCNLFELTAEALRPTRTFSIGGTVSGSSGPIVLQNSNGTNLIVPRDGSFTFETPMVSSAIYNVRVAVPPRLQTCVVANGAGTVALADISDVIVTCTPNTYTVSRTITARDFP